MATTAQDYMAFLERKEIVAQAAGIKVRKESLNKALFPFQAAITQWALQRGRAAIFAGCGLGKSAMQLDWARIVVKKSKLPVLILAPLGVTYQTVTEGEKFAIEVLHVDSHPRDIRPAIYITNYEKLHHFVAPAFGGIVIDESSILKAYDSKTRNAVIEAFANTAFRLACTATPAPNDAMELGNHSEFLGIMTRAEMLATFFTHDGGDTSKWRLKGHAKDRFWKWVASWAVLVNAPSDIGFSDEGYILPPLIYHNHVIPSEPVAAEGMLFSINPEGLNEQRAARKASLPDRVQLCVDLIKGTDEQFLVWCDLNAEQDTLAKLLGDKCVSIQGSTPDAERLVLLKRWLQGKVQTLASKPSVFGFGLNFQNCHNVAFVGLSHSWEKFYQATRRVWRFGQTQEVNCHVITSEAEGAVLQNIQRKDKDAIAMQEGMLEHMKEIGELTKKATRERAEYKTGKTEGNGWTQYLGDSIEVLGAMEEGSVDYIIKSDPFQSLYTYSNSVRDLGNCASPEDFREHMRHLVAEMFRVLRPGRLMSTHCMNLPTSKTNHGYIGLQDFRGDLIRLFQEAGFIFHSEVVIWKDPVTAMQRTKALGLLYKQLCKDSAMSRQGIPDYLVTMRKPGVNEKPVAASDRVRFTNYIGEEGPVHQDNGKEADYRYAIDVWQRYASPVWMDINPSDTLQFTTARDQADERHICPLQLQVIERAIELWTNPGDLVLDPFAGIGSTGYVAVGRKGRRYVGCELKESYYKVAVKNLQEAERKANEGTLFSLMEPQECEPDTSQDALLSECDEYAGVGQSDEDYIPF